MAVLRPRTPQETVKAYAAAPKAIPLAGGTDFMVAWNRAQLNGRTVLDLSRIQEWTQIHALHNGVRIGSLATHARIQRHPLIRKRFPLLAEACAVVGAAQIQNRGTIGGNIANASPAGDTFPPLAVYEATVHVVSLKGWRVVPFLDIFSGVKKTVLGPGELIEAVEISFLPREPHRQIFRKVGSRLAQTISKTVAAGLLFLEKKSVVHELRFALGSVAPTVRRLKTAEDLLKDRPLTPQAIEEACSALIRDISPIDDIRSTKAYRSRVSQNILRSFLDGAAAK
jgi:xanthine dehydrogenase small subunit